MFQRYHEAVSITCDRAGLLGDSSWRSVHYATLMDRLLDIIYNPPGIDHSLDHDCSHKMYWSSSTVLNDSFWYDTTAESPVSSDSMSEQAETLHSASSASDPKSFLWSPSSTLAGDPQSPITVLTESSSMLSMPVSPSFIDESPQHNPDKLVSTMSTGVKHHSLPDFASLSSLPQSVEAAISSRSPFLDSHGKAPLEGSTSTAPTKTFVTSSRSKPSVNRTGHTSCGNCGRLFTGHSMLTNQRRHRRHSNCNKNKLEFKCYYPGCHRKYSRSDNLKKHNRKKHQCHRPQ